MKPFQTAFALGLAATTLLSACGDPELPSSPAGFFPDDTQVYFSISMNNETQRENWASIKEKMGWDMLLQMLNEDTPGFTAGLDMVRGVIGGDYEMNFAMADLDPEGQGTYYLLLKVADPETLLNYMVGQGALDKPDDTINDVPVYYLDDQQMYLGVTEDYIVATNLKGELEGMLTREEDESLTSVSSFSDDSSGYIFHMWANMDSLLDTLQSVEGAKNPEDISLLAEILSGMTMDFVVSAESDQLNLLSYYEAPIDSSFGKILEAEDGNEVHLYELFPAEENIYFSEASNLSGQLDYILSLSNDEDASLDSMTQTLIEAGVDLDLASLADGSYAMSLSFGANSDQVGFSVLLELDAGEMVNPNQLVDALINDPTNTASLTKTESEFRGGTMVTLNIQPPEGETPAAAPFDTLYFATFENYFLVTTSDAWMDADAPLLMDDVQFKEAIQGQDLGEGFAYLDMGILQGYLDFVLGVMTEDFSIADPSAPAVTPETLLPAAAQPWLTEFFASMKYLIIISNVEVDGDTVRQTNNGALFFQ